MADKSRSEPRVLLVSLPWTTLTEPSAGLGLLKAVLTKQGVPCRVWHLNVFLLRFLRASTYVSIATVWALCDFVFGAVIDPEVTPHQRRWLRLKARELIDMGYLDARQLGGIDGVVAELLRLRNEVIPAWLAEAADEVVSWDASLVGFTCMFDQTVASLALGRLVKDRSPETMVVLGGYAVRPPTAEAVLRSFPQVDAVCVGEGEPVVEALATASVGRVDLTEVPGMAVRGTNGEPRFTQPAPAVDLDTVPPPDYDDFFADLRRLADEHAVVIEPEYLPVENSRGCWWGASSHCVFCGIHDDDLVYRAKDAQTVLTALQELARRYGMSSFRFTDYILPRQYYTSLMPELIRRRSPYRIAAEVKANITPDRFARLADAGFVEVQPGIESFSSNVLRDMDKGVSAGQNVLTLLLGRLHGIKVHYNLLYGLPSDDPADYELMLQQLPRLYHLDPPSTHIPVQITRYAPLQVDPARFGLPSARPDPSYELVFSRSFTAASGFHAQDFCYYFERPFEPSPHLSRLYHDIERVAESWAAERASRDVTLEYQVDLDDGHMTVFDSRTLPARTLELDEVQSRVLEACSQPASVDRIALELSPTWDPDTIRQALAHLDANGLVFKDRHRVIGLPLPRNPPPGWPSPAPEATSLTITTAS